MDGERRLDGNAVAGLLGEIFTAEMTLAEGTCDSCGHEGPLGEVHAYLHAPGAVLRCPACGGVVMTIVSARQQVWLNLAGTRRLRLAVAAR